MLLAFIVLKGFLARRDLSLKLTSTFVEVQVLLLEKRFLFLNHVLLVFQCLLDF